MRNLLIILTTFLMLGCGSTKLSFTDMVNLSQEAAQAEVKAASFYEAEALPGVRGIRAIYRGSDLWPSLVVDVTDKGETKVKNNNNIQQCYYTTGEADFVLIVTAKDMENFEEFTQLFFLHHL